MAEMGCESWLGLVVGFGVWVVGHGWVVTEVGCWLSKIASVWVR